VHYSQGGQPSAGQQVTGLESGSRPALVAAFRRIELYDWETRAWSNASHKD